MSIDLGPAILRMFLIWWGILSVPGLVPFAFALYRRRWLAAPAVLVVPGVVGMAVTVGLVLGIQEFGWTIGRPTVLVSGLRLPLVLAVPVVASLLGCVGSVLWLRSGPVRRDLPGATQSQRF